MQWVIYELISVQGKRETMFNMSMGKSEERTSFPEIFQGTYNCYASTSKLYDFTHMIVYMKFSDFCSHHLY